MNYLLASVPIGTVLALMLGLRWGAHKAGAAGLAAAGIVGALSFGLTPEVLQISQVKGLLLSLYVLAVMWPALFLFHWLNSLGAIEAAARALERLLPDPGLCALAMAWCLSAVFEGVAGFGLPVAIVSPMLVAIGVQPVRAVAAVAIGHSWAVTFGSMGLIFQTLVTITGMEPTVLAPAAALLLGVACIGCGMAAAVILGQQKNWRIILLVGAIMAAAQYFLCRLGLTALGSFAGGVVGLVVFTAVLRLTHASSVRNQPVPVHPAALRSALACYGALAGVLAVLTFFAPLRHFAEAVSWSASFHEVSTRMGFVTDAAKGPAFRPLTHPGALITMVTVLAVLSCFSRDRLRALQTLHKTSMATLASGGTATLGILFMVGMATIMDHCGMTLLLAKAVSRMPGSAYPIVSPLIGVLGAFATGSNNNSNIMFAMLQKNAANLLQISPALILAGQTAGGSLGSMIAPAKLVIGCSTVGLAGQEGLVLRKTLGPMLALSGAIGLLLLALE